MADIDELLTDAGERWRAGQPPVPDLQALIAQRPVVRPRLGSLIVVVALLAVIALVGTSPVGGPRPSPSPSHVGIGWDQSQLEAAIVHSGDRVTARGVIIAPAGEAPKLCVPGADDLMGDPPVCLPIAVSVDGVDLDHLPGRTVTKGTISSAGVEAHGTWTGTAIRVERIAPSPSDPYNLARMPCPEPQGGWRSAPSDLAFRAALDPLVGEIAAKPETYGSYWTMPFALPDVEIVETRVDPATVRARVDALFPFSACLLRGTFTPEELAATQTALHRDDLTWIAGVEDAFHRVRVELTMLDEAAVAVFVAHPDAYPAPLVTRDSPDAMPQPSPSLGPDGTPRPTSMAEASPELVNGLPLFLDGQQVLTGDLASTTVQGVRDGRSILVGGWVHPPQVYSCPAIRSPYPWNACGAMRLFPSPYEGPLAFGIFRGSAGIGLPDVPTGSVEPVVLRIHTHDATCTNPDCTQFPVLDSIAWQGSVQPAPSPTSTRPPSGIGEQAAIEAALRVAAGQTSPGITVVAVQSGPYALVGPGDAGAQGDAWVWAITVGGDFAPLDCYTGASTACIPSRSSELIVLDYTNGTFLIADSPAPKPVPTTDDAGKGAINLVSKLEIDRAAANWDDAWRMLGPLSQQRLGSEAQFVAFETAYNEAGGGFTIDAVVGAPFDATTTNSIGSEILDDLVRAGGDPSQAELVYVTHPDEAGASAASVAYLVAHVDAGWRIWIAH